MHSRTRLILTALVATFALSAAVSTANARRIELSSQFIRTVWTEASPLELVGAFSIAIRCRVTIEGSFHSRTLSKVCGQLVGYITRAAVGRPCEGGEAWVQNGSEQLPNGERPNTLPWHILYISFRGTLPRIERVRLALIGVGFLAEGPLNVNCLYKTTTANPAFGEIEALSEGGAATGEVTGLVPDETISIPTFATLSGICSAGRFKGRGTVTQQESSTRIRIRLVQ